MCSTLYKTLIYTLLNTPDKGRIKGEIGQCQSYS